MEDIPNKVRDALGLIVDVDLITENGLDTIKIEDAKYFTTTESGEIRIDYKAKIWNREYDKILIIENIKK